MGELFIEDGAKVSSGVGVIGKFTGSTGAVYVTGEGAEWNITGRSAAAISAPMAAPAL